MFKTTGVNDFVGQWLAGAPVWIDRNAYWANHSNHHNDAGTTDDPDLRKYQDYAIPKKRLARKITRDLTGITAYRTIKANVQRGGWRVLVRRAGRYVAPHCRQCCGSNRHRES